MTDADAEIRDDDRNDNSFSDDDGDEDDQYQYYDSTEEESFLDGDDDEEEYNGDDIENDKGGGEMNVNAEKNQYVFVNLASATLNNYTEAGNTEDSHDSSNLMVGNRKMEDATWTTSEDYTMSCMNTKSVDDSGTWMSDFEVISRGGTSYHLCRRCSYVNHIYDPLCQGCETALVANPMPDVDAMIAQQLHQNEQDRMIQQVESDEHLCEAIFGHPTYDKAMTLLHDVQNFLNASGTFSSDLTSQLLVKPELHSLAVGFIENYLSYRSVFENQRFSIALYYHTTTVTINGNDLMSSDCYIVQNVAMQKMIQECQAPSRPMVLSKQLETYVKASMNNYDDESAVAVNASSSSSSSSTSLAAYANEERLENSETKIQNDENITNETGTTFRYTFIVATIKGSDNHVFEPIEGLPEFELGFVRPNDTIVFRSCTNPIPLLPLICLDVSQPPIIILNGTTDCDSSTGRISTESEYQDFLYRGLDTVCHNFLACDK